jgi:hypothetical protein
MKWFDNFIGKPITNIFRLDKNQDYEYYQPLGILLMFDKENGFLLSTINDGISINLEATTFTYVYDYYGVEFEETIITTVEPGDELYKFIGQCLTSIKIGVYNETELSGDTFIIKQGKYAGIIVASEKMKFTFYNSSGGWLWLDELQFPNKSRWTLQ